MKSTLLILCGLTLAVVLSALAISRKASNTASTAPAQTTFVVKGTVRGIDVAEKSIRIEHEEIPDYMPEMTMPFSVKEVKLLSQVTPGDSIRFVLAVTDDDSWISNIEKVDSVSLNSTARKATASAPVREVERIQTGEQVPNFSLVDQNGDTIHLSNFRGKAVLVTFIYTRCPIPNFCPLMSKNFADLQQRLSKQFPGKFQLISVSIDPEFDRPEVLKDYGSRYTDDLANWTFATGTREQTDLVANLLGLVHQPENGLISHDLRTALIGPDGKLVQLWKSNVWTPYEVQRRVADVFGNLM